MKFYDCAPAPSPRLVRMFIAEKGLSDAIETVDVDLGRREQFADGFRAINPFLTVPVLEADDGRRFVTTQGCWRYLEGIRPDPPLLGRDPAERGAVADWVWRVEFDGFLAVAEALRNTLEGLKGRALTGPHDYDQIPELGARGRARIPRFFAMLDAELAGREHLAGEAFSAADIMAFVTVEFAGRAKQSVPDDAGNLRRWYDAVKARPSAAS